MVSRAGVAFGCDLLRLKLGSILCAPRICASCCRQSRAPDLTTRPRCASTPIAVLFCHSSYESLVLSGGARSSVRAAQLRRRHQANEVSGVTIAATPPKKPSAPVQIPQVHQATGPSPSWGGLLPRQSEFLIGQPGSPNRLQISPTNRRCRISARTSPNHFLLYTLESAHESTRQVRDY